MSGVTRQFWLLWWPLLSLSFPYSLSPSSSHKRNTPKSHVLCVGGSYFAQPSIFPFTDGNDCLIKGCCAESDEEVMFTEDILTPVKMYINANFYFCNYPSCTVVISLFICFTDIYWAAALCQVPGMSSLPSISFPSSAGRQRGTQKTIISRD